MSTATIITAEPNIIPLARMALIPNGLERMARLVFAKRPEAMPEDWLGAYEPWRKLFPHEGRTEHREYTGNELMVELSGRKCYDSFGKKAGQKTNSAYVANTQGGTIPHASIMYHAKMSFYIDGVSRRVSHELIRHYVGADRDEEGSPSQESTRYTECPGRYIAHPYILNNPSELAAFELEMTASFNGYKSFLSRQANDYARAHDGNEPKGMDRKRIYEAGSSYLHHSVETSFIWTTNPVALAKLFVERDNEAADLEFLRFARTWKKVAFEMEPNLFRHKFSDDPIWKECRIPVE